jgi:hypothetical protein
MRPRVLHISIALASAFLLSAFTAASASAISFWQVEEQELETGTSKEESILKSENYFINTSSTEIKCGGQTAKGAKITGGEDGTGEATLEFSECKAAESCTIPSTITAAVKTELVENTGESTIYDLFLAKSGSTLATIEFKGAKCPLSGTLALTGTVAGELSQTEEKTQQSLTFPKTAIKEVLDASGHTKSIGLKLGGSSVTFLGASKLELKSKQGQMPLMRFIRVVHPAEYTTFNQTQNVKILSLRRVKVDGLLIRPFPQLVTAFTIGANGCEALYMAAGFECNVPVQFTGATLMAGVKYINTFAAHPEPWPANEWVSTLLDGEF